MSFIPALLCFFVSFLAEGRSGIIVSLLLLISVLFLMDNSRCSRYYKYVAFFCKVTGFVVFIIALVIFNESLHDKLEYFYNKKFDISTRNIIWLEYIRNLSLLDWLVGFDLQSDAFFKSYHSNLHNSYLMAHARFGIMAVPLVFFLWFACISGMLDKQRRFLAVVLFCLLLRIFTDKFAFVGHYDFVIYFYAIYLLTIRPHLGKIPLEGVHPTFMECVSRLRSKRFS
ncbi:hypothetical protein [Desulfogranum marinum]|uniref:hypothetical protein n=1 Tax=Desulfogranum marinum TaxID=453220 RepID=UPI0029C8B477|nr:hypothetical protein [Desulfogranum marinum]